MNELAVTTPEAAPVVVYKAPDMLASLVRIKPSRISLNQLTTRVAGAKPGFFRDNDTGEQVESLTVAMLDIKPKRVMHPPGNDFSGLQPICRSQDGIVPSPFAQFPQSSSCGSCQQSQWKKEGGKNIKPPCSKVLDLLGIDTDSTLPIYINFSKSGLPPFEEFIRRIEKDRLKVDSKTGSKPEVFDYFFTIKSQEIIGTTGKYYIPLFTDVQRVSTPAQFGKYYERYVTLAHQNLQEDEQPVDSTDSAINTATAPPATSVLDAQFTEA